MSVDLAQAEPYSPPDSSPDPYSTSPITDDPATTFNIDISTLPRALPILGPLTGYTTTRLARTIAISHAVRVKTVSRPLTAPERESMAYHTAKSFAIASYGPAIGIASTTYRFNSTMHEFRWPFFGKMRSDTTGEGFWDGEKMRIGGKEVLAGWSTTAKATLLHVGRGIAYGTIALMVIPEAVRIYGALVGTLGENRDPRMRELNREMRGNWDVARAETKRSMEEYGKGERKNTVEVYSKTNERGRTQEAGQDYDDASPSGGAFYDDNNEPQQHQWSSIGESSTSILNDDRIQTQEIKAQPTTAPSRTAQNRPATFQVEKANRQPKSFADDYAYDNNDDDANPTASTASTSNSRSSRDISSSSSSTSGTSVWERIRQGQQPEHATDSGAANEVDYIFSNKDEEKRFARDEAQREFDKRVERERRGGDFGK